MPRGDVRALRTTIERLLRDEQEAERLGVNARRWVQAHADIAIYASSLAVEVGQTRNGRG